MHTPGTNKKTTTFMWRACERAATYKNKNINLSDSLRSAPLVKQQHKYLLNSLSYHKTNKNNNFCDSLCFARRRNGGSVEIHSNCPPPYTSRPASLGDGLDTYGSPFSGSTYTHFCYYACPAGHYNPTLGTTSDSCQSCPSGTRR